MLWKIKLDTWHLTHDTWNLTCDMRHVVGGKHSLKIPAPQLLRLGIDSVLIFCTKGWPNQPWLHQVCRKNSKLQYCTAVGAELCYTLHYSKSGTALHWTVQSTAVFCAATAGWSRAWLQGGASGGPLHCTALHCTACTELNCTALHCTALHCTALHCTALHSTALHCSALYYTALQCISPPCNWVHCRTLEWPAVTRPLN